MKFAMTIILSVLAVVIGVSTVVMAINSLSINEVVSFMGEMAMSYAVVLVGFGVAVVCAWVCAEVFTRFIYAVNAVRR